MSVGGSLLTSISLLCLAGVFGGLLKIVEESLLPLLFWCEKWNIGVVDHEAGGGLLTKCSCTCAKVSGSVSPNSCKKLRNFQFFFHFRYFDSISFQIRIFVPNFLFQIMLCYIFTIFFVLNFIEFSF